MYLFNCYAMVTPRLRRCTSPYSIAFTFTSTTADVYEPPADVRATCCSLASIARAHALAFRHRRFWSTERIAILLLLEFRSHYRPFARFQNWEYIASTCYFSLRASNKLCEFRSTYIFFLICTDKIELNKSRSARPAARKQRRKEKAGFKRNQPWDTTGLHRCVQIWAIYGLGCVLLCST